MKSSDISRTRRCIVTRLALPIEGLIRFVRAPDGRVVPDLRRRLPGRGVWVRAERRFVEMAVRKNLFARGFKAAVIADDELTESVDRQFSHKLIQAISMARMAGQLVAGRVKVEILARSEKFGLLIQARDGVPAAHREMCAFILNQRCAWDGEYVNEFTEKELSSALGLPRVVHAAVRVGPMANACRCALADLRSYRGDAARPPALAIG